MATVRIFEAGANPMTNHTELRQKALDATKGPWDKAIDQSHDDYKHVQVGAVEIARCGGVNAWENAAYIAAADPQTILELLDEMDAPLELIASWAIKHGFATGHADTIQDLLCEVGAQIEEIRDKLKEQTND